MNSYRYAIKNIIPIIFSYIFLGIACGILLQGAGYAPIWAFFAAVFIYAGSMQIVMVSLMTSGISLPVIALMTLFINARHMFYGIGFIEDFKAAGRQKGCFWKYPYMVLALTDETYSVLCQITYPQDVDKKKVQFYILISCHLIWIVSCTLGALVGDLLPFDMSGIEFCGTAFFAVVVVSQWMEAKSHIPALTGFISAVFFYLILGPDKFILPALGASSIVLMFKKAQVEKAGIEISKNAGEKSKKRGGQAHE